MSFKKGKKEITQVRSFTLRAWEVALGGALLWLSVGAPLGNGKGLFSFDPFNILPAANKTWLESLGEWVAGTQKKS